MTVMIALLLAGLLGYLILLSTSWQVLDDPDFFTRERTEDLIEHFRFFGALPKPDREWNR